MQSRDSAMLAGIVSSLSLLGAALIVMLWQRPGWLGIEPGSAAHAEWLQWVALAIGMLALAGLVYVLSGLAVAGRQRTAAVPGERHVAACSANDTSRWIQDLKEHLQAEYGVFWWHRMRVFWVFGDVAQVEAIAPGLTRQRWLEDPFTVLISGGQACDELPEDMARALLTLRLGRPLDGIVWALTSHHLADTESPRAGVRHLRQLSHALRWQVPLHLWQVCDERYAWPDRPVEAVGVNLSARASLDELETGLQELLEPLRIKGLDQALKTRQHHFLMSLCRDLRDHDIALWRRALTPWLAQLMRTTPLRGVWFSLAHECTGSTPLPHTLQLDDAWKGVLDNPRMRTRRIGWPASRLVHAAVLTLALLWGLGMLLSFNANRQMIETVQTALTAVQQDGTPDQQLLALYGLMNELDRLAPQHGVPWYARFGLSRHQQVFDSVLPQYVAASRRLLLDPTEAALVQALDDWLLLPASSPARAEGAAQAYERLKTYLMLARPDRVDAAFLQRSLMEMPPRDGVSPGLWQSLAPKLWRFHAEQLVQHPEWRLEPTDFWVAEVRQELLRQLGQRNAQASLYRQVLERAAPHYPALALETLTGDTDARALFRSDAVVPGVYTRQAWEGRVRQAIDEVAQARREQIDWVLSDRPADLAAELGPEALAAQLTARYFQDYANAWLGFLASLRWQPAGTLEAVIDQLTLVSDPRQSPLLALVNGLVWHGQAGTRGPALGDSLIRSAQQLIGQDKTALAEPWLSQPQVNAGPLDATFGPWHALLGQDAEGRAADSRTADSERLSLQAFLNRVTRVRLKLQQVSHASDPQAMTQALAQSVFQGRGVDFSDTRDYGRLLAASLGAEWGAVGQTLFVQPLDQAWQRVLQPSAASLDRQWQRAIVTPWEQAFAGRYPFAATDSDASLALLGQMVRADSGQIEQFLQRELGGVLRKEGNRWVADPANAQGLRFNPQFLEVLNQLTHLGDVLFTDGGLGLGFELRAKPVRDLVQTTFTLNGATHQYFNQRERWQRFSWPGLSDHPGVTLRWIHVNSGERLFGDYQGTWGLIRLLEQARITPLDDGDSRYQVLLEAPDGLGLTWHLRTELGAGPMTLLKLRGFKLPRQIFLSEGSKGGRAG